LAWPLRSCESGAAAFRTIVLLLFVTFSALLLIVQTLTCSVYRAIWRGRCVAVKVVQLPAEAIEPGRDPCSDAVLLTRERMAVMEAVVSITMSHPNIVQVRVVHHYNIVQVRSKCFDDQWMSWRRF
jgi:hypothetical protein